MGIRGNGRLDGVFGLIQRNKPLNYVVRNGLVLLDKIAPAIARERLMPNCPVYGQVSVRINNQTLKLYSNSDDKIVDNLYYHPQEYSEIHELRLFGELARHSKVVLDIGANSGVFSILAAKSNSKSRVFSFEPHSVNIKRLAKNLLINDVADNVEIVPKAVGNSSEPLEFTVPANDKLCDVVSADSEFTRKFFDENEEFEKTVVKQTSIDDFVQKKNLSTLDLIKIDVENYELQVLQGSIEQIKKHKPVILAEIFVDKPKHNFVKNILQPLGYQIYAVTQTGLQRLSSLEKLPEVRNYIFCQWKSPELTPGYLDTKKLAAKIAGAGN